MARPSLALAPSASLVLASALWGVATVISKELLISVPPITLLILQLVPSVATLWLLVAATGARPPLRRELLPLALIGLINPGLSYTLSMLGLRETTASVATLLWAAEPALIVALAWLVLREAVTVRLVALTATAAIGVVLVGGGDPAAGNAAGVALILGGVICCALYTVVSRRIAGAADPLIIVAIQQTTGLAWAAAIWPLDPQGSAQPLISLTQKEMLGGAASGLMYYAAAFWLYLNGLRSVPASTAGIFINLTPVFGIATAYAALGERLAPLQWAGAATILISVALLLRPSEVPRP